MSALADHAAAAAPAEYGQFEKNLHIMPGGDGHLWWRSIDNLPLEENRARVIEVINDDAKAYKRLGYAVDLEWSNDGNDADMFIRHKRTPNYSDIALLEGAMAATLARAGWGGSG